MRPVARQLAAWLFLLIASVTRLRGDVIDTITSLTLTNHTGYVLASDSLNALAGYTRDTIDVL
jgi:hypothetical protein